MHKTQEIYLDNKIKTLTELQAKLQAMVEILNEQIEFYEDAKVLLYAGCTERLAENLWAVQQLQKELEAIELP